MEDLDKKQKSRFHQIWDEYLQPVYEKAFSQKQDNVYDPDLEYKLNRHRYSCMVKKWGTFPRPESASPYFLRQSGLLYRLQPKTGSNG